MVGISHGVQQDIRYENSITRDFLDYLETEVRRLGIKFIAEEYSRTACVKNKISQSTIKNLAIKTKVSHYYCDPGLCERKRLGIPTQQEIINKVSVDGRTFDIQLFREEEAKYFPQRERHWLNVLEKATEQKGIFVCGSAHLATFAKLLIGKGHKCYICRNQFEFPPDPE
ncbi:MAG TPA: hypothetical protein VMQ44_01275 [Candidatus Saccharimonadales bacterium]|nr:hypothetical protein [Candidatus Saccharimonadales bacterium]